jgi:hypothetical protein
MIADAAAKSWKEAGKPKGMQTFIRDALDAAGITDPNERADLLREVGSNLGGRPKSRRAPGRKATKRTQPTLGQRLLAGYGKDLFPTPEQARSDELVTDL